MEKLGYSRHFHIHYDLRLLHDDRRRTAGFNDHCKIFIKSSKIVHFQLKSVTFLDTRRTSKMLSRNHLDWLSSLSHSRFAMVSKSLLVLPAYIQLFLLRRKSLWLFWRSLQSSAVIALPHHLSSIHLILSLLHWICVVCSVISQEILHEAVQLVCMDTCCIADCRHTKLFDHSEHFRRWVFLIFIALSSINRIDYFAQRHDLVRCASYDDSLQWCHGVHVWLLLWQDAINKAKSKEDMGGLYRRRLCYSHFRCGFLLLPMPLSILRVSHTIFRDRRQNGFRLWAKLFVPTTRVWNSNCKIIFSHIISINK